MKLKDALLWLLLLLFSCGFLLQSYYAPDTSLNTLHHSPPLKTAVHHPERGGRVHETARTNGRGAGGGRGVYAGGDIIRQPKRPRNGGCFSVMPSSLFLSAVWMITMILFLGLI